MTDATKETLGLIDVEVAAQTIYDSYAFHGGWVPWEPGGNSTMQDHARGAARKIAALAARANPLSEGEDRFRELREQMTTMEEKFPSLRTALIASAWGGGTFGDLIDLLAASPSRPLLGGIEGSQGLMASGALAQGPVDHDGIERSFPVWLIEWPANRQQPVRYWHPTEGHVLGPQDAVRFARECDAQSVIKRDSLFGGAKPVEHIFGIGFDWSEYEDEIGDAISDSLDMDWSSRDGAKAVVRYLKTLGSSDGIQGERS